MHKGLAQQCRRAQSRLRHALRIEQVHLGLQELVQDGENHAVENVLDLGMVRLVVDELRTEQEALQLVDGGVSDEAGWIRRLSRQR